MTKKQTQKKTWESQSKNSFLIQFNEIDVLILAVLKDKKMSFEITYDKKDLKEKGLHQSDFESELQLKLVEFQNEGNK